jgi:co-chaperonin GroES (HSP10)
MKTFKPLKDKVAGKMIDGFGIKKTAGGLLINEKDGVETSIRPRWFQVTHIGDENTDFKVGDYILVAHGRWTRGFTIDNSDDSKYYVVDLDEILGISDKNPLY